MALLLALAFPLPGSAQSAPPWIGIVGQPPFVMPADEASAAVPLLVRLAPKLVAGEVSITLLDVRYDRLVDQRVTEKFSVAPTIERGEGRGPAILVTVSDVAALRPGAYELTIGTAHPTSEPVPPIVVTLERPGVELQQPGKITLDVFYPFPLVPGSGADVYPQELRLRPAPASKFARISDVSFYASAFRTAGDRPSRGTLALTAGTPVAAGQPLVVAVAAADFPAGVSSGSIEVSGPDLTEPRTVDIDVRARHSTVWVVVLIALGLLLGFLVRVVLQKRVTVGDARARAATVAGELERHLARTPDKVFADTVKPVLVKLREALDGDDGEAMTAEAATATEALKGATAGLQTRVTHTHARLRTFQIIAADASALPPELAQVVRHASEVCARAADHLDRLDPTRAADALDALEPALTGETASALADDAAVAPGRARGPWLCAASAVERGALESAGGSPHAYRCGGPETRHFAPGQSIRQDARQAGRELPAEVPPGPNNPLGDFWLGLSGGGIGIHGTNVPASIYRTVTHGCVRLHPADIEWLFSRVPKGGSVQTIYEPMLLAEEDSRVFLEVHRDAYRLAPVTVARARTLARDQQNNYCVNNNRNPHISKSSVYEVKHNKAIQHYQNSLVNPRGKNCVLSLFKAEGKNVY
jgi:hypothetical protein